jgi:hypothetical protein
MVLTTLLRVLLFFLFLFVSAPCLCGTTGCSTKTGLYCYSEASECKKTKFTTLCAVRNGLATNSGPCKCGKVDCDINSGKANGKRGF